MAGMGQNMGDPMAAMGGNMNMGANRGMAAKRGYYRPRQQQRMGGQQKAQYQQRRQPNQGGAYAPYLGVPIDCFPQTDFTTFDRRFTVH